VTATQVAPEASTTTPEASAEPDLTAFKEAVASAIGDRDETTGEVPTAPLDNVKQAYRGLDGAKAKRAARDFVSDEMMEAMAQSNIGLARAFLMIQKQGLVAGSVASGTGSTPRTPADPTEAFVQLVSGLRLALTVASENVPEGVAEEWADKAKALVSENLDAARTFLTFSTTEQADDATEPEAPAWVKGAVKLSQGKSAKVGAARAKSTGGGSSYTGARRSIPKHIEEAFADKDSGAFLRVSEIVNFKSAEYGTDQPSAGAVSASLKSEKFKSDIVKPDTQDGKLGARKL
jgi:hypothetical protein